METLEERATGGKHQTLLCQGPVELRRGWRRKKQHLSLFSDVLVVSNSLHKRKFKIKYVIPVSYLWMSDNVDTVGTDSRSACKSILLSWPAGNFVATFGSMDQKDRWSFFLQRSINEATKDHRKYLKFPIFTEDIPDCDSPLYVTTTDLETVNDVTKKLLPMIGMPSAQDYQLWFRHGHKEALSLLQEHEHPYDIIMRNIQNTFNRRESRNRTGFPALPGLYVEQPDIRGRFILKPRDPARSQQQSNAEEAKVKRRPFTSWLFRRGSVPRQDQVCTAPPVTKTGKLFGNDLTAICEDGNLPMAILDILSFISEKGPITEGIFRTSGDIRAFRDLKERLDSGTDVTLINERVPVVATILKEFLQNIPGSVLTSRLYDEWLSVLDQECDGKKVAAIQSLLEQLPQPNAILLKQLFGILYNIMKNSEVNHMTSSNLAVCISLSILCLPSSCNSALADVTKKISLVNFLIENYLTIFGEDVSLCDESSLLCSDGEKACSSLNTPGDNVQVEENEDADDACLSEGTCPTDNDAVPQSPAAPLHNEGTTDSEKQLYKSDDDMGSVISQDNVCLTPPAPKEEYLPENAFTPPAPQEEYLAENALTPGAPNDYHLF